jgi:hypothetical protein
MRQLMMAFSRSRKSSNQQGKRLIKMDIKPSSGLDRVMKTSPLNQGKEYLKQAFA